MKRQILIYGACDGLLIVLLQLVEYRFLVIEHSLEIYGALVAAIFAGVGVKTHSSRLFEKLSAPTRAKIIRKYDDNQRPTTLPTPDFNPLRSPRA